MKGPQFFLPSAFAALALIAGCAEQPSDPQADTASDGELLAHTPHAPPTAALLLPAPAYSQLDDASVEGSGGSIHLGVDVAGFQSEPGRLAHPSGAAHRGYGPKWRNI
jgi:hypothetical protein